MMITFRHYPREGLVYVLSKQCVKDDSFKEKMNITERWQNGDWMALNEDWINFDFDIYMSFSQLNFDWKITERRLSVLTEWWIFSLGTISNNLMF